jgi:hypothetical protein
MQVFILGKSVSPLDPDISRIERDLQCPGRLLFESLKFGHKAGVLIDSLQQFLGQFDSQGGFLLGDLVIAFGFDVSRNGDISTNWAESFFSRLRRAERGIHHVISGP